MSQTNRPSTPSQKWGLFLLLTGALGFSLSMNPDHFNNIARNEGPLHVTDMAQTAATPQVKSETANAGAAPKPAAPAAAPAQKTRRLEQIKGKDSKGNDVTLDAEAVEIDGKTYITFKTDCANCNPNLKNYTLTTSSLNNVDDLRKFATDLANKETKTETAAKTDDKSKVAGKATEVDLEEWAKECENKKDQAKLNCHKKRLLALSKHLKNDEEQADLVKDYFMEHLHAKIRDGLTKPTLAETSAEDCDITKQVYRGAWGQVGCRDHEQLEDSRTMAKDIIAGLRAANGKSVAKILMDLETKSYPAQMTSAQRLAQDGKREANGAKLNAGLYEMNFFRNRGQFSSINQDLLSSISQMPGSDAEQSALRQLLNSTFTSPISKLLTGLESFATNGRNILDARIEDFIATDGLLDNGTRGSRIAGQPGNLGRAGRSARKNTTLRDLFAGCPIGSVNCGTTAPISATPSIFNKVGTPGMLPGLAPTPAFNGTPGTPITRDASGRTRR